MKDNTTEQGRLLRSAEELKAYFEEKIKKSPLAKERTVSVREALEGLLLSAKEMESNRDSLDHLQARLGTIQEGLPSNVIQMRVPRRIQQPSAYSKVDDKRWILRLDCLIESKYVSEIHKMAMELHSQSRRYAFIEFRDIDKKSRHSLPDLLAMGAISLFVPCILDLHLEEQKLLRELMEVESLQRPLLMVGSTLPYSQLRGESGVDMDFLNQLSRAYIKLTRPFTEYKEQGLIHYFLDSLSESPT
jgi:hypothetical protein